MEVARLRAQVRVVVACKKKEAKGKEGVSSSAPKVVDKGVPKRKADGKDNCLSKRVFVTFGEKLPKRSSPSKPKHRVSKGRMTTSGLITQELDCHFLTHKDYAVEMIESIINDKDVDPYAEEATEELGASGLFDLGRVCFFLSFSTYSFLCLNN